MSTILKIKRSSITATPSSLVQGELAYSELSQNLFFGSSTGVIKIGGLSDVQKLAAATHLKTADTLVLRDNTGSAEFQNLKVYGNLDVTGNTTVSGQTVYTGDTVFEGDIFVNGGDIKTTATSFRLLPDTVQSLEIAPTATAISIGGAATTTSFLGDVNIGGSLSIAESATVAMNFLGNDATLNGNLVVKGNTQLGDSASDTTTIQGFTSIVTPTTMANASASTDAFIIKTQDNNPLFQVKQNGDTVIAGVLTVNGTGTSTFAGDVSIGGSITVAEGATVTADFTANTATIVGDLMVDGNTFLGNNAAEDSTYIKGMTTVQTARTKAQAAAATTQVDAFKVVDSSGAPLFQIKDNGDTTIAGVINVLGDGTSYFAGDVSINGKLTVAENATSEMQFSANDVIVRGDLVVEGNTFLGNQASDETTIVGSLSVSENASFAKDVTVEGNLVVNGTTTTVNSTQTTLSDPVLSLAQDTSAADAYDRGVDFKYHDGSSVKRGFFGYDVSTGKYSFLLDATETGGAYSGSAASIVASRFEGLADRAERLETARTISLAGDVAGSVSFDGSQNVTITTSIQPNSVELGVDTFGAYARSVTASGLGISVDAGSADDATDYVVSSNATVSAVASTLVYRGPAAEVKAAYFVAETGVSRFKGGIDGLAEDGTTKSSLENFVIDGGTF